MSIFRNDLAGLAPDSQPVSHREALLPPHRLERLAGLAAAALMAPVGIMVRGAQGDMFYDSAASLWPAVTGHPLQGGCHTICRHVANTGARVVLADARTDGGGNILPALYAAHNGAFLALPILDRGGAIIGAVCAIDHAPQRWSRADLSVLAEVSELVRAELADNPGMSGAGADTQAAGMMINELPVMVWSAAADGRADGFNDTWHGFTGTTEATPDDAGGAQWQDFVHPDDSDAACTAWQRAVAAGLPFEACFRLRNHSGAYRAVLARAEPVRGAAGAVLRWCGSMTDIQCVRDHESDRLRQAQVAAEAVIDQLSVRAAYAKAADFENMRAMIALLRQIAW